MSDSDLSPRQQRLATASMAAAAAARASAGARRERGPAVGDRCLLPATAAFPVEWVLIDQRAAPPVFLAVLADIHPLVGSADLAVAGALRLRCRSRAWLDPEALAAASVVGALDRITVEKVRRKILEVEQDPDPAPAGEVESSLEYQDWQRDVIAPALAAVGPVRLSAPPAGLAPGRQGLRGSLLAAMAASLLFMAGLAGWTGLQSRQIDRLAVEKRDAERALKSERARREQTASLEDRGRQSLAEMARQSAHRVAELERRLAAVEAAAKFEKARPEKPALPQVLVNVPVAILNPTEVLRGDEDSEVPHLKARAPYMTVVLNVDPEPEYPAYRAVLKREGNPAPLWQSDQLESTDQRLQLLLDSSLLPPGAYRFDLYGLRQGRAEPLGEYGLAIDR